MEKRTLPTPAGGVPGPFTKPTVPVVGAPHVSCTTAQPSMSPGWTTTVAATATAAVASAAVPAARAARSRLLIIPPSLDTSSPYPGSGHRNAALHARGVLFPTSSMTGTGQSGCNPDITWRMTTGTFAGNTFSGRIEIAFQGSP